jgi:hypothetical protein
MSNIKKINEHLSFSRHELNKLEKSLKKIQELPIAKLGLALINSRRKLKYSKQKTFPNIDKLINNSKFSIICNYIFSWQ